MVETSDLDLTDLDAVYPKRQLDDSAVLDRLKEMAVNVVNDVFGGAVRARGEVEGNEVDFALWVWAHMVSLRQKEETSSESGGGGSMSWARPVGDPERWLEETRFGRTAKGYLRGEANIGIEQATSSWE